MSKKGGIADVAVGRSDVYRMNPSDLHIKEDWNGREAESPENQEHIARLAASIAQVGVKQPLTVYWENGKAFVSDGHMRLAATLRAMADGAEIKSVPVQTEDRYSSEADRVFSQIVRNSGKPLAPIEQGRVFKRLIDLGWTEAQIAEKSGLNRAWVVDLLGLQAAPEAVTSLVKNGTVAATLAMKAIKQNRGDTESAAADLTEAVEKAKATGKSRATAKHMGTKKPSLKTEIAALLDASTVRKGESSGNVGIIMSREQFGRLCELTGFVSTIE